MEQRAAADLDDLTRFPTRPTGLLPRSACGGASLKPITIGTASAAGLLVGAALTRDVGTAGPAPVPATTSPDEPVHEATP